MKKLEEKDKKTRRKIKLFERKKIILKLISSNENFFNLIRLKARNFLNTLPVKSSQVFVTNRCINTINKKKFNKLTNFSRTVFLKLIKNRDISNIYKSTW